jgi:hypothetical protein
MTLIVDDLVQKWMKEDPIFDLSRTLHCSLDGSALTILGHQLIDTVMDMTPFVLGLIVIF